MTESRPQYRTAGGTVEPDTDATSDTTALPRIEQAGGWQDPSRTSGRASNGAGAHNSHSSDSSGRQSSAGATLTSLGSKLSAAGASAVAAATSAASSAKEALRNAGTDDTAEYSSFNQIGASVSTPGTAVPPPPPAPARAGRPAQPAQPAQSARPSRSVRSASRQPRKARLTLSHINVYSVFKFSCVLAIALFFVWLIAVGVLYGILDVSGVLSRVNDAVAKIDGSTNPKNVVTGSIVFGGAIIIGAVYIVLFIALSTIGSMVYNLCADLVGGVELTLSERD
jgi:hypothetical protein